MELRIILKNAYMNRVIKPIYKLCMMRLSKQKIGTIVSNEKNNDLGLNHNTSFSNPWFKGKEYHKKLLYYYTCFSFLCTLFNTKS